jgi:hypothetical protein
MDKMFLLRKIFVQNRISFTPDDICADTKAVVRRQHCAGPLCSSKNGAHSVFVKESYSAAAGALKCMLLTPLFHRASLRKTQRSTSQCPL